MKNLIFVTLLIAGFAEIAGAKSEIKVCFKNREAMVNRDLRFAIDLEVANLRFNRVEAGDLISDQFKLPYPSESELDFSTRIYQRLTPALPYHSQDQIQAMRKSKFQIIQSEFKGPEINPPDLRNNCVHFVGAWSKIDDRKNQTIVYSSEIPHLPHAKQIQSLLFLNEIAGPFDLKLLLGKNTNWAEIHKKFRDGESLEADYSFYSLNNNIAISTKSFSLSRFVRLFIEKVSQIQSQTLKYTCQGHPTVCRLQTDTDGNQSLMLTSETEQIEIPLDLISINKSFDIVYPSNADYYQNKINELSELEKFKGFPRGIKKMVKETPWSAALLPVILPMSVVFFPLIAISDSVHNREELAGYENSLAFIKTASILLKDYEKQIPVMQKKLQLATEHLWQTDMALTSGLTPEERRVVSGSLENSILNVEWFATNSGESATIDKINKLVTDTDWLLGNIAEKLP